MPRKDETSKPRKSLPLKAMGGFRFASLNVRGIHSRKKQNQLHRLLEEREIDFLAVQETNLENEEEVDRALQLFFSKYEVCVSHAVGLSGGCFLFIKKVSPVKRTISDG